jgi:hypothetical protein
MSQTLVEEIHRGTETRDRREKSRKRDSQRHIQRYTYRDQERKIETQTDRGTEGQRDGERQREIHREVLRTGTKAHSRRRSLATTTHLLHSLLLLPLVFGNCGGVDCERGREKVMTLSWALYLR